MIYICICITLLYLSRIWDLFLHHLIFWQSNFVLAGSFMDDIPSIGSFHAGWGMGWAVVHTDTRHGQQPEPSSTQSWDAGSRIHQWEDSWIKNKSKPTLSRGGGVAAVLCTVTVMASECPDSSVWLTQTDSRRHGTVWPWVSFNEPELISNELWVT